MTAHFVILSLACYVRILCLPLEMVQHFKWRKIYLSAVRYRIKFLQLWYLPMRLLNSPWASFFFIRWEHLWMNPHICSIYEYNWKTDTIPQKCASEMRLLLFSYCMLTKPLILEYDKSINQNSLLTQSVSKKCAFHRRCPFSRRIRTIKTLGNRVSYANQQIINLSSTGNTILNNSSILLK